MAKHQNMITSPILIPRRSRSVGTVVLIIRNRMVVVVRKQQPVPVREKNCSSCIFSIYSLCSFIASKSTGQSSTIATQDAVTFEHHDDINFLVYKYNDIELTVSLICRDSDKDSVNGRQDDPRSYAIILQSRCCCPGKCRYSGGSLSGGAVFVIILLVLVSVYIIGGMIYMRVARGASGVDLIPNRSLWLGILDNAKHGFKYCIQVIRGGSSSGDYQKT